MRHQAAPLGTQALAEATKKDLSARFVPMLRTQPTNHLVTITETSNATVHPIVI